MSGGARMLTCRKESGMMTDAAGLAAGGRAAGAATAGAAARHALRHLAWSMSSAQQSSAGIDMLMLSHGAADAAQALASGPRASQKASSAAMSCRAFTPRRLSPEARAEQASAC